MHESSVDKFLDALTTQPKFPFSTEELRQELKHTFWLLNRVDSARALAKKLELHPIFGEFYRKENAYVFDFDPARTLIIYERFANDLSAETSEGKGDSDKRKNNIKTLLNFFPVIGEDEEGEMVELDAEKVLSIPRKIKSQEVIDIIQNFTPVQEQKARLDITPSTGESCL